VTGHEVTAAHSKDGPSSPRTTLKVADLFEHFPVAFFRSSN
jgi:hypothetical protein